MEVVAAAATAVISHEDGRKTCISELVGGKDVWRKTYRRQNSTTGRGNGRDGEENVGAERKRYDDDESEAKEKR